MASFTVVTVVNLFALQSHEAWAVKSEEFIHGLSFNFPDSEFGKNPLFTAIATFGIIGVGAAELLAYPYWYGKRLCQVCRSKRPISGMAQESKRLDKSNEVRCWGAMFVYTFCTVAFYLLGAAILGRTGLLPEGSEMIQTLSTMYTPVFGKTARIIFLSGAIAVLFSTFFIAIAAQTRLCLDLVKVSGIAQLSESQRNKGLKILGIILPIICVSCYIFFPKPVILVLISGTMQAIMLLLIGFAVLYFRYNSLTID